MDIFLSHQKRKHSKDWQESRDAASTRWTFNYSQKGEKKSSKSFEIGESDK